MGVTNPIEHLAMAPKSLTTSIHNVNRIQKEEMAQAHLAEDFKNTVKKGNEQTIKSQKSEYKEYRYDRKEKGGRKDGSKKQRHQQKPDEIDEDDVAAMLGRSLDIRI